ncbi:MAG: type II secretion system F family protein, partial [Ruminiclostridium sp.]|nr:type II secretion system F family protein [Ruminiclostridium sp.]
LLQAMEVVARIIGNRVARDGVMKAREEMRKGMDLATPIKRIGVFPPMVDSMIRIGEESGTLDDILDKTANFYDEEVDVAMQRMVGMMEPLMIVVMAGIVGFIVISMALPMFDMLKTVDKQ